MGKKKRIIENVCCILLSAIVFSLSFAIVEKHMTIDGTDYQIHAIHAIDIFQGGVQGFFANYTYPLWHLGVKIFERVFRFRLYEAAATTTALIYLGTFWVCAVVLCHILKDYIGKIPCFLLAFFCLIVQPITYETLFGSPVGGTLLINTWHNPTNIIARMFGIIAFFVFCDIIQKFEVEKQICRWEVFCLSASLILANLGKPSLCQIFLPAATIFCVTYCICTKFRSIKICLAIAGALVAPAIMLVLQMLSSFGTGAGGIEIAWFDVMSTAYHNVALNVIQYLLFPTLVSILLKWQKRKSIDMRFAWVLWIIGFLEYAALAEIGERRYHGNFGWAFSISNFVLQFVSLINLVKCWKTNGKTVLKSVATLVYLVQVICGCIYLWWQLSVDLFWY